MYTRFIRILLASVIASTALCSFISVKSDYVVEDQPQVIERAFQFEPRGTLKQKDNGYLYVAVSNDFIGQLLPLIDAPGKMVPPSHYTSKKGIGAHISVMYENEQIDNEIWVIDELGQTFDFAVKELRTVKISKNGKMKKLWLLAVDAPGLEKLRESYGLSSKLKGHDFHITLATQVPGKGIEPVEKFIILDDLEEEHLLEIFEEVVPAAA